MSDGDDAALECGLYLVRMAKHDKRSACIAALAILDEYGAGVPDVPLFQEQVRSNAMLWAACAHQAELEAYLAAAIGELKDNALLERQIKRITAMTFGRMSKETKEAFKKWMTTL